MDGYDKIDDRALRFARARSFRAAAAGGYALRIGGAGLAFTLNFMIARLIGPGFYGQYATVLAAAALLALVASLGLPAYATRQVAAESARGGQAHARAVACFSLVATLSASAAVGGAVALGAPWMRRALPALAEVSPQVLILVAVLVPLQAAALVRAGIARGLHRPILADVPELAIRPLAFAALLAALTLAGSGKFTLTGVLACYTVATLGATLAGMRAVLPLLKHEGPWVWPVGWFGPASRYWLIGVIGLAIAQIPLYLLGLFAEADEVGRFAIASQLAGIVLMAIASAEVSAQGRIAEADALGDRALLQAAVTQTARVTILIALTAAVAMALFGPLVLALLGEDYAGSSGPLLVLVAGYAGLALCGPSRVLLTMTGREKTALAALAVNALVMLAVGIIVVPRFGAMGAAGVAVLATVTVNLYLVRNCRVHLGIDPLPLALKREHAK